MKAGRGGSQHSSWTSCGIHGPPHGFSKFSGIRTKNPKTSSSSFFWWTASFLDSSRNALPVLAQWCPEIPVTYFLPVSALGSSKPQLRTSHEAHKGIQADRWWALKLSIRWQRLVFTCSPWLGEWESKAVCSAPGSHQRMAMVWLFWAAG